MFKEFKDFVIKGNALDLAVGVLIGASFAQFVTAFTEGIIKPLLSAAGGNPEISLKLWIFDVGIVLNALIALIITGAILFFVFVKPMTKLKQLGVKPAAPPAPLLPSPEERLLIEIRDLLKQREG